jgi:3-oxoacyl-[acyl-carrier protein] reductase
MPDDADVTEAKKALAASLPLKCMPSPEDVAYAALYLASDEAKMLTGTCINVDAGRGI